jgi:hypothetical protein
VERMDFLMSQSIDSTIQSALAQKDIGSHPRPEMQFQTGWGVYILGLVESQGSSCARAVVPTGLFKKAHSSSTVSSADFPAAEKYKCDAALELAINLIYARKWLRRSPF